MVKTTSGYKAKYTNLITGFSVTQNLTDGQITDVPRVYQNYYSAGNKLEILNTSNTVLWTGYFKPFELCRYTAVLCDFVNKYGCWQRTWFFAASNDTFSIENTEYNLMQSTIPNYNTLEGQRKVFNTSAKKSIKVNTDWVTEEYNELLKELMVSEKILINNYPAKLNTKSTELFKTLKIQNDVTTLTTYLMGLFWLKIGKELISTCLSSCVMQCQYFIDVATWLTMQLIISC